MSDGPMSLARCVPLGEWPAADRMAWERALRDDDLLEEAGLFAHLKPLTIATLRSHYGRWLHFLATHDPASLAHDPATRISRERVVVFVEELRARNAPITVANRVLGLERAARAFAPRGDWRWLRTLVNKLFLRAKRVRDRRARLRPPQDVFRAASELMETAETGTFTSVKKRALAYRDGLLLAILAARAPRVGNLGMIEIGKHLRRAGAGCCRFDGSETKNGDVLELPLPDELTVPIERYLAHWRPVLLEDRSSERLWISGLRLPDRRRRFPLHRNAVHAEAPGRGHQSACVSGKPVHRDRDSRSRACRHRLADAGPAGIGYGHQALQPCPPA